MTSSIATASSPNHPSHDPLPSSSFPIYTTIAEYRKWRHEMMLEQKSVGFIATMGALHDGHLSLVRRSLAENDLTVVSIFVNPAQFAPHEDLGTYPRTLETDVKLLEQERFRGPPAQTSDDLKDGSGKTVQLDSNDTLSGTGLVRGVSALFLPSVTEMYPDGITQDVQAQKGTFIEVKGYDHQMEGKSRPTFFRGVATVVTKLFNIIQPDHAYFGQKDIQQGLILRRLARDLLLSHPEPQNVHIIPTARDPTTHLALSSRNAYLTPQGLAIAPALHSALRAAEQAWNSGLSKRNCVDAARAVIDQIQVPTPPSPLSGAEAEVRGQTGAKVKLDYVEMNDSRTFDVLEDDMVKGEMDGSGRERVVILSGAMWVGKTRLIDNILLGDVRGVVG